MLVPPVRIPTISRKIGCGGTILEMNERYPGITFHWVVFSAIGVRAAEAQNAASSALRRFRPSEKPQGRCSKTAFPDGFMPYVGAEVRKQSAFEELKKVNLPRPDLHSQSERCASGPSPHRRAHLELLPRPSDP